MKYIIGNQQPASSYPERSTPNFWQQWEIILPTPSLVDATGQLNLKRYPETVLHKYRYNKISK